MSKKLDDKEIVSSVTEEIRNAVGVEYSDISKNRETVLKYYLQQPYGDEMEGRSSVVTSEVLNAIEWALPSLIRVFTSGDRAVQFEPVGEEDEEAAKQETDVVNHVFYKQNDGFMLLYTAFKDALLSKTGVFKCVWEKNPKVTHEMYKQLTEDELAMIAGEEELEITEQEEEIITGQVSDQFGNVMETRQTVYNVKVKRVCEKGKVKVSNVPPEEFIISSRSNHVREGRCGHRVRKTIAELKAEGYSADILDSIATATGIHTKPETQARRYDENNINPADSPTISKGADREIWVYEWYQYIDRDGDGKPELLKLTLGGDNFDVLIDIEEIDEVPFYTICPIPITHKFYGLSMGEIVADMQRIKSSIFRNILDNIYFINNQRWIVLDGAVNIEDILSNVPGQIIRENTRGAVRQEGIVPLGNAAYQLLGYTDAEMENRVGITKYNQGLDSESLNKTATGLTKIMENSMQRLELIARIFAETGIKELFLGIHRLLLQHQRDELSVKLRGKWTTVNPSEWKSRENMTVNVGIGTGNQDAQASKILQLIMLQKEAMQVGLATPAHIHKALIRYTELMGEKSPNMYWQNPDMIKPEQPKPSPEEIKANVKMQEIQTNLEVKKAELQLKNMELQLKQVQLQILKEEKERNDQIEVMKVAAYEGARLDKKRQGGEQ